MGLLKGIPAIISPELLYVLASMGHGDKIVFADANFPSASVCSKGPKLIPAEGHDIPTLLKAVLQLFPVEDPHYASVMQTADGRTAPVWEEYAKVLESKSTATDFQRLDRFKFYEEAKTAFAVVHTGERALYGNIILTKGVIP